MKYITIITCRARWSNHRRWKLHTSLSLHVLMSSLTMHCSSCPCPALFNRSYRSVSWNTCLWLMVSGFFRKFPLLDTFVCQLLLWTFSNNLLTLACLSEFVWPDVTTWDVKWKNFPGDNLCGWARLNTTVSHFTYGTISTCLTGSCPSRERQMQPRWLHAVPFIRFIFPMHIKNVFFFTMKNNPRAKACN